MNKSKLLIFTMILLIILGIIFAFNIDKSNAMTLDNTDPTQEVRPSTNSLSLGGYGISHYISTVCIGGYKYAIIASATTLNGIRIVSDSKFQVQTIPLFTDVYNLKGRLIREHVPMKCEE